MSIIRQLLGTGVLSMSNPLTQQIVFSWRLIPDAFTIPVFKSQTGAFLTFAILAAYVTYLKNIEEEKKAAVKKAAKGA